MSISLRRRLARGYFFLFHPLHWSRRVRRIALVIAPLVPILWLAALTMLLCLSLARALAAPLVKFWTAEPRVRSRGYDYYYRSSRAEKLDARHDED